MNAAKSFLLDVLRWLLAPLADYVERYLLCYVITLRSVKGAALTHAEMDANFTTLRDTVVAVTGTFSSTLTVTGAFVAAGANNAIGVVSAVDYIGLRLNMQVVSQGGSNFSLGVDCDPSLTLFAGDTNYAAKMGIAGGTITTQAAETVGLVAALRVGEPIIVLGAGSAITVAATVYIVDAPTEGATNAALYVASGATILGGSLTLTTGNMALTAGTLSLASTSYLYLDGGGDTYIRETAANTASLVAGGNVCMRWENSTIVLPVTASPTGAGAGVVGQIAWDTLYLYICTATNDWRRVALTDF